MAARDPEQRPTAAEAFAQWGRIRGTISTATKEWRPCKRNEDLLDKVTLDVVCMYRLFMHFARSYVEAVRI